MAHPSCSEVEAKNVCRWIRRESERRGGLSSWLRSIGAYDLFYKAICKWKSGRIRPSYRSVESLALLAGVESSKILEGGETASIRDVDSALNALEILRSSRSDSEARRRLYDDGLIDDRAVRINDGIVITLKESLCILEGNGMLVTSKLVDSTLTERLRRYLESKLVHVSDGSVVVVNPPHLDDAEAINNATLDRLGLAAAQKIYRTMRSLASTKKREIAVAMGSGATARIVAKKLLELLQTDSSIQIVFYEMSSSVRTRDIDTLPVHFLIKYAREFDIPRSQVAIGSCDTSTHEPKCAQWLIENVDFIITSVALFPNGDKCECSMLMDHMRSHHKSIPAWQNLALGEVQFCPYGSSGFLAIPQEDRQSFDLPTPLCRPDALLEFRRAEGKRFFLVVGPCYSCGEIKARAIRPLLQPELRIWSDFICDDRTAKALLGEV